MELRKVLPVLLLPSLFLILQTPDGYGQTISGAVIETCVNGSYNIEIYLESSTGSRNCTCPDWIGGSCCQVLESVHGRLPSCVPLCENGGVCISEGVCSCPSGYNGGHCEMSSELSETLNPTLPLDEVFKPLSWYDGPQVSWSNKVCFVKVHAQNSPPDVVFTAESYKAGDNSSVFGKFSSVARDQNGGQQESSKFACLQVRCPGKTTDEREFNVEVKITVQSVLGQCRVIDSPFDTTTKTVSEAGASTEVFILLEHGDNYGSHFGIYVAMGYLSKAMYVARESCFAGSESDFPSTRPEDGVAIQYDCAKTR